jgi:phospholipase/carboxylesterase
VPTAIEPQWLTFQDWTFRYRQAETQPGRLLILLHGWMGDENSMWQLARKLSSTVATIAPRAPFPAPEGGYSWRVIQPGTWGMPTMEDLHQAIESLLGFIDGWSRITGIASSQFDLMGFSQGAAATLALALLHPDRVRRVAVLSGFFPGGGETLLATRNFSGLHFFVSHGRQDTLIPVEEGRKTVRLLESAAAPVIYCESDAGHKVSRDCLNALGLFMGED